MSLQSRLSDLITAVGADIKSLQTQLDNIPGASSSWSEQIRTTTYVNATVVGSDVFTGFTPEANTRYLIEATLLAQSNAATNGIRTALLGPLTGITRAGVKISSAASATADKTDHINGLNTYQAATAGLTTPSLLFVSGLVDVGGTPGIGNIRVGALAEGAAANAVQIFPGSMMRWRQL